MDCLSPMLVPLSSTLTDDGPLSPRGNESTAANAETPAAPSDHAATEPAVDFEEVLFVDFPPCAAVGRLLVCFLLFFSVLLALLVKIHGAFPCLLFSVFFSCYSQSIYAPLLLVLVLLATHDTFSALVFSVWCAWSHKSWHQSLALGSLSCVPGLTIGGRVWYPGHKGVGRAGRPRWRAVCGDGVGCRRGDGLLRPMLR